MAARLVSNTATPLERRAMFEPTTPTADPLPWVTDRLRRAGAFIKVTEDVDGDWRRDDHGNWKRDQRQVTRLSNDSAAALLDILTQTVSALHDDDKTYVVVLSKECASAGTLLERKVVEVGSRPMRDDSLTDGQKAAVMAGLVLHEVGHIRYGRQYSAAITRLFGKGNVTGAIGTLSNLAADMHDETAACAAFPGLAPTIPVTLWWVGGKGQGDKVPATAALHQSAAQRVNMAIAACRYPWQVAWDSNEAREWREWWVAWGERATLAEQPAKHALIVKEAIEKVRDTSYTEDEEPQTPTKPQPQPRQPEPDPEEGEEQEQPAPGRDMSDEDGQEQEPEAQPGEGEDEDESGDTGHGDDDDAEDEDDSEGAEDGQGTQTGQPDMNVEPKDAEDGADFDEQGSFGGSGKTYDENEYSTEIKDPCVKDAAQDPRQDRVLQQGAEFINRGKREGMRIRTYHHQSSQWGKHGRRVVAHGKKGKRWVAD